MVSPYVTWLKFWHYIEIGIVQWLVHEHVENKGAYEEDRSKDENEKPMS